MNYRAILRTQDITARAAQMLTTALVDEELHECIIRVHKGVRSLEANSYYWKLIADIADFMGEDGKTGREYVSVLLKQEFLEPISKMKMPNGDWHVVYQSTADMNVKELSTFCEQVERWAVITLGFVRETKGEQDGRAARKA